MGWSIRGSFPYHLNKYIVIVAPHTSNWDFLVGVFGRSITRMGNAKYLGKMELFRFPYGWIFRALGGYPVDRSRHSNMVDAVVEIFNENEQFVIVIAPEGTRKKVEKLKTGFYYIAKKTKVPIVMVSFDYSEKIITIAEPFETSHDYNADMDSILEFYRGAKGKNPELGLS